jgi:hypothetical protein
MGIASKHAREVANKKASTAPKDTKEKQTRRKTYIGCADANVCIHQIIMKLHFWMFIEEMYR